MFVQSAIAGQGYRIIIDDFSHIFDIDSEVDSRLGTADNATHRLFLVIRSKTANFDR